MSIQNNLLSIKRSLPEGVVLVAVSKTKPNEIIKEAYHCGQRIFGENKVQDILVKYQELPKDIKWHMIGHLQKNKVKYIAPFISLIHGVDSFSTLREINKQAKKHNRVIECLLQVKIAEEESKFGLSIAQTKVILESEELQLLTNIEIVGLMGMASFTEKQFQIQQEFQSLKKFFDQTNLKILSMGMSNDYQIAIDQGSTMIRVGSAIFGSRNL